mmetsp:Transcript_4649/g.9334  ORF Transcript_4649/g.9334 Transcript_4649/m.9334 type:complete len:249 (+) Transcript_4649:2085-2831(+)
MIRTRFTSRREHGFKIPPDLPHVMTPMWWKLSTQVRKRPGASELKSWREQGGCGGVPSGICPDGPGPDRFERNLAGETGIGPMRGGGGNGLQAAVRFGKHGGVMLKAEPEVRWWSGRGRENGGEEVHRQGCRQVWQPSKSTWGSLSRDSTMKVPLVRLGASLNIPLANRLHHWVNLSTHASRPRRMSLVCVTSSWHTRIVAPTFAQWRESSSGSCKAFSLPSPSRFWAGATSSLSRRQARQSPSATCS